MSINTEAGVRKTLVATFRAKGLSPAQAEAKATQHLSAACECFDEAHGEAAPARDSMKRDEGLKTRADRDGAKMPTAMLAVTRLARTL